MFTSCNIYQTYPSHTERCCKALRTPRRRRSQSIYPPLPPSRIDKNVPFCSDKSVGSRRPTDRTSASEAGNSGSNPDESARIKVPPLLRLRCLQIETRPLELQIRTQKRLLRFGDKITIPKLAQRHPSQCNMRFLLL